MIRVKTKLENNGVRVTLIDIQTEKDFTFWAQVDVLERLADDLSRACSMARDKLGMPPKSNLIVPFVRNN